MTNNNTTNKFVLALGISPDLQGYAYTIEAINMVKKIRLNNEPVRKFTQLYSDIAQKFDVKAQRVERDIRYAVERAFIRNSPQLKEMFEMFLDGSNKVPNSCFVCTVAEHLIMNNM